MALATPASLSLCCSRSFQSLGADGGTTAAARAALRASGQSPQSGHQSAGQPLAWASAQVPPSTYHIISLCSRCISLPPSHLCSARKQQVATVQVLSMSGHTMVAAPGGRSSSPSSSELCPGHTMPVMDRPHHQGPNLDLYWNQLVLARGYQDRFLGHKTATTQSAQLQARLGEQRFAIPPRLLARLRAGRWHWSLPNTHRCLLPHLPCQHLPCLCWHRVPIWGRAWRGHSSPAKPSLLLEGCDTTRPAPEQTPKGDKQRRPAGTPH